MTLPLPLPRADCLKRDYRKGGILDSARFKCYLSAELLQSGMI